MKLFVFAITLLLLLSGLLVAVEGEATDEENGIIEEKELGENVEITEENGAYFEVNITDYPEEIELGEKFEVEYTLNNIEDVPGEQNITISVEGIVEGQEVWSKNETETVHLDANEKVSNTTTFDTSAIEEEYGERLIELEVDVNILVETENDYDEATITVILPGQIPGFTFTLLVLGVIFTVAIYRKKR